MAKADITLRPETPSLVNRHASVLPQTLRSGALLTTVGMALYVLVFVQTGAWQVLAAAVGIAVGVLCLVPAYRLARRGYLLRAGYWMLLAAVITFGSGELVWANTTLYTTLGCLFLLALIASVIRPRNWTAWVLASAAFLAFVFLVNRLEPLARFDVTQQPVLRVFVPAVTGLLGLAVLWRVVQAFHIGTIRARLLITFAAIVLVPATVGIASTSAGGLLSGQQQVISQLESIVTLKQTEIETWLIGLQRDLSAEVQRHQASQHIAALLQEPPSSPEFQVAYAAQLAHFQETLAIQGEFDELFLLDARGRVILSTDEAQLDRMHSARRYFQEGLNGPFVAPPYFDVFVNQMSVMVVEPIAGQAGQALGIVAGRANLGTLSRIMLERAGLGETGETYLVGANYGLLTESRFLSREQTASLSIRTQGAQSAIDRRVDGSGSYANYLGEPVIGVYRWLPALQVALIAEQEQSEAFGAVYESTTIQVGLALTSALITVIISIFVAREIATPLAGLAHTAEQIAAGDLDQQASVERDDEVGRLARSFNAMTSQLRSLIDSLELQVESRTEQLRTSAEVGRAAASILDPDRLLREVANLITDRFGFYYAAMFTLDEAGQHAVLRAATGEAGRVLEERGHKLKVGRESMVGAAITTRKARIALDVGEEPIRFANPLLPQTRSEIALPLVVGDHVFGALDVQSTQEAAFDETSAAVLQAMADQIAVALNNANSYAEAQAAVQRSSVLYKASQYVGRLESDLNATVNDMLQAVSRPLGIGQWWVVKLDETREQLVPLASSLSSGKSRIVRVADQPGSPVVRSALHGETHLINDPVNDLRMRAIPEDRRAGIGKHLSVPIISRGTPIGAVSFGRSVDAPDLTERDVDVGRSLASLTAIAIENRSLLAQTQRALHEVDAINRRLTGEAWTSFSRRLNRDGVTWVGSGSPDDRSHLPEIAEALSIGRIAVRPAAQAGHLGVAVPILLRGTPVGALRLSIPEYAWSNEMAATLESIAGHVAQAAENARLVATAEDRARRERALAEATDKIRRKADMANILETAAEELAHHLKAARVAVRVGADTDEVSGNGQDGFGE